jgi:hypothetical protein
MHISVHSDYLHCSRTTSLTSRTAVYGPVRTVVWQGSAGDCRPYADQVGMATGIPRPTRARGPRMLREPAAFAGTNPIKLPQTALDERFGPLSTGDIMGR